MSGGWGTADTPPHPGPCLPADLSSAPPLRPLAGARAPGPPSRPPHPAGLGPSRCALTRSQAPAPTGTGSAPSCSVGTTLCCSASGRGRPPAAQAGQRAAYSRPGRPDPRAYTRPPKDLITRHTITLETTNACQFPPLRAPNRPLHQLIPPPLPLHLSRRRPARRALAEAGQRNVAREGEELGGVARKRGRREGAPGQAERGRAL